MNWLKQLSQDMTENTKEVERFFIPFGYLLATGYLGFYFFNSLIAAPTGYENLPIRVSIAVLGLGLILKNYWLSPVKIGGSLYWYFTMVYSLPFFFFFMLFHNPESNIWQINGLVGMVTLTFFVDWLAYIVLTSLGILVAYIAFCCTNDVPHLSNSLFGVFGSYSAPVIYLVLFSYQKKRLYQEKQLAEVKILNSELTMQAVELQKALAIKTQFLNNLSHEIRSPLTGVVSISELLLENWHKYPDDERYKSIAIISRSGERLLKLINSLLDFSKFTSGTISVEKSEENFERLAQEIIAEHVLLHIPQHKNLTIEMFAQPELDSSIVIDAGKITQVLHNLIGNAIKFTESGKIKLLLIRQGKHLEIIVDDEGIGIPEDELETIFHPFVQSSKTTNKAGGTGLGLAICKEIVNAHNGLIWAENKPNKGSMFHFLLPQFKNIVDYQLAESIAEQSIKGVILMIDDDLVCHNIISMIFKNANYKMVSVYTASAGLDYLNQHKNEIDLVLLDLMMPDMYGINVLQAIKADKFLQHIPVIIQSASNDINEHSRAFEFGAANFFSKPYDQKKLVLFINKLLIKSR